MTTVEKHKKLLEIYDIQLIKECKSFAIVKLKGHDDCTRIRANMYSKLISAVENANRVKPLIDGVKFGVELEFIGTSAYKESSNFDIEMLRLTKGDYFRHLKYAHNDGQQWILGTDGSIKWKDTELQSPIGIEISSRLLDYTDDSFTELSSVIDLAKTNLSAFVNDTCGTHIHLGLTLNDSIVYIEQLLDVLSVYTRIENKVFDPIVPSSRRRNKYCKPTRSIVDGKYFKTSARYCRFNPLGKCTKFHLEFRQLEGTLDAFTIKSWLALHVYILCDILSHVLNHDYNYIDQIKEKNIFDLLFYYNFSNELINFFIHRAVAFKSRSLSAE